MFARFFYSENLILILVYFSFFILVLYIVNELSFSIEKIKDININDITNSQKVIDAVEKVNN